MNTPFKLSPLQLILLLMTSIGLKNHVIIIPPLLREGGRDAWISVFLMYIFILVWGVIIFYIYRTMKGKHITDWLENSLGKVAANILVTILAFYLIMLAGVTLKETIIWTNVSYLTQTPVPVITILFAIPCLLAALTSLRTIVIANFFFLFFVIIFGFFVAFANTPFKDYSLLLPILEHGMGPVYRAMIYQGSGMIELTIILLYQHKFKSTFKYWHFIILAILLSWLTLGPLVGAIVEFGPVEAASQRYPAYEEWGLARLGKYVEHVDYLSIYQWLSGAFIRITLILFTMRILFEKLNTKANYWLTFIAVLLIVAFVIIPLEEQMFFNLLMKLFLPLTFWFFLGVSIILAIIAFIERRKTKDVSI